jgi:hypothetical protein
VACEIIAAIKKRDHVFLIKRFVAAIAKVGWNAREVKVNSVALGDGGKPRCRLRSRSPSAPS